MLCLLIENSVEEHQDRNASRLSQLLDNKIVVRLLLQLEDGQVKWNLPIKDVEDALQPLNSKYVFLFY